MKVRVKLSRGSYIHNRENPKTKGIELTLHLPDTLLENTEAMQRAFEAAHQVILDHFQGGVLRGNPVRLVIEVDSS